MKLVQTLVVRDEADIVDTQIAYHLNAGVDFVIATDHESEDGTTDILEAYVREGCLRLIPERGENREAKWRTRMARLAATDHDADWVINTDADEFWMARQGTLKEALSAVPERFGVVWALSRHFVPRPDDDAFFADRMVVRVSPPVAINDPTSAYRPHLKAAHRADPEVGIGFGAHTVRTRKWRALHHWHPFEVLHFPFRSREQWERKGARRARGDKPLGQYVTALLAREAGRSANRYRALVVDDSLLEQGSAVGSLAVDLRLRDALREAAVARGADAGSAVRGFRVQPIDVIHPRAPGGGTPGADQALIADSAAVRDADVVRLFRHLDGLRARLHALEDRPVVG